MFDGIASGSSAPLSGAGQTLARNIMAGLEYHYPTFAGYWRVRVNEQGGIIEITNLMLSGKIGVVLHIAKLDPEGRKAMRAGGELLDRFRISRDKGLKIRDIMVQKNNLGNIVHD